MLKKFVLIIIMIIALAGIKVEAKTDSYVNLNGTMINVDDYENLLKYYSEHTINTFSSETIDKLKDVDGILARNEIYIRIDSIYDVYGNIISHKQTEVTEAEAYQFMKNQSIQSRGIIDTHTTSMKKLTLEVLGEGPDLRSITLTNKWLSLPKVRSFDVIAIRPVANVIYYPFESSGVHGYQLWDNNEIAYTNSSANTRVVTPMNGTGGIGISMNIVNDVFKTLECSMTVIVQSNSNPFIVEGTYQHAISTVTLSQSQNYDFHATGLGGVLQFKNSTISNKYDGMQGVTVIYNNGD